MATLRNPNEGRSARRTKILVVLPAFNEAANIGTLLERIDDAMTEAGLWYHVVVVDDGSVDNTVEVLEAYAEKMPLTLSSHRVNQGLGSTIRDGLFLACQAASDRDIVITMDADDTHTPGLILRMVRMVKEGYDVVIASRYRSGSRTYGVPLHRRFLSASASWVCRVVFPTKGVRDFTSGYRAYRGSVLRAALSTYGERFVDQEGFQCMVDILLKLRRMGVIFGEAPLILRYDLKEGKSKMNISKTVRQTLALLVRRRLGL